MVVQCPHFIAPVYRHHHLSGKRRVGFISAALLEQGALSSDAVPFRCNSSGVDACSFFLEGAGGHSLTRSEVLSSVGVLGVIISSTLG